MDAQQHGRYDNLRASGLCAERSAREKTRISHEHSLTLDLRDSAGPVRVLIAEPEQDMQTVYK